MTNLGVWKLWILSGSCAESIFLVIWTGDNDSLHHNIKKTFTSKVPRSKNLEEPHTTTLGIWHLPVIPGVVITSSRYVWLRGVTLSVTLTWSWLTFFTIIKTWRRVQYYNSQVHQQTTVGCSTIVRYHLIVYKLGEEGKQIITITGVTWSELKFI